MLIFFPDFTGGCACCERKLPLPHKSNVQLVSTLKMAMANVLCNAESIFL